MAIALVQSNEANGDGSSGTIAVALTGVAAGNCVVVFAECFGGQTVASVADDLSAAATEAVSLAANPPNQDAAIFYYLNHGGGNRTFTATFSAATTFRYIVAAEFSGVAAASAFEGKASANNSTANPSTGNLDVTPSVDGMLVVGFLAPSPAGPTAGAGFTIIQYDGLSTQCHSEYLVQGSAAAVAATWTLSAGNWVAVAASFKPAAGGGSSVTYALTGVGPGGLIGPRGHLIG